MPERPPHTSQATLDRGRQRRDAILGAAADLFAVNGYRGTGLAAVADRVGVTQPTILHHFGSKKGLLTALVSSLHDTSDAALIEVLSRDGSFTEDVLPLLADVIRADSRRAHLLTVLVAENLTSADPAHDEFVDSFDSMRSTIAERLRIDQAKGALTTTEDVDLLATRVLAVIIGLRRRWASDPNSVDLDAALRSLGATLG